MGLVDIFGSKPVPKVLDFLRVHRYWDYSIKDISKATSVSYRTLQTIIPQLAQKGFITYTRTEGKAKMYIFNSASSISKQLQSFARESDFRHAETMSGKTKPEEDVFEFIRMPLKEKNISFQ